MYCLRYLIETPAHPPLVSYLQCEVGCFGHRESPFAINSGYPNAFVGGLEKDDEESQQDYDVKVDTGDSGGEPNLWYLGLHQVIRSNRFPPHRISISTKGTGGDVVLSARLRFRREG
jgi:hypothetical protein